MISMIIHSKPLWLESKGLADTRLPSIGQRHGSKSDRIVWVVDVVQPASRTKQATFRKKRHPGIRICRLFAQAVHPDCCA